MSAQESDKKFGSRLSRILEETRSTVTAHDFSAQPDPIPPIKLRNQFGSIRRPLQGMAIPSDPQVAAVPVFSSRTSSPDHQDQRQQNEPLVPKVVETPSVDETFQSLTPVEEKTLMHLLKGAHPGTFGGFYTEEEQGDDEGHEPSPSFSVSPSGDETDAQDDVDPESVHLQVTSVASLIGRIDAIREEERSADPDPDQDQGTWVEDDPETPSDLSSSGFWDFDETDDPDFVPHGPQPSFEREERASSSSRGSSSPSLSVHEPMDHLKPRKARSDPSGHAAYRSDFGIDPRSTFSSLSAPGALGHSLHDVIARTFWIVLTHEEDRVLGAVRRISGFDREDILATIQALRDDAGGETPVTKFSQVMMETSLKAALERFRPEIEIDVPDPQPVQDRVNLTSTSSSAPSSVEVFFEGFDDEMMELLCDDDAADFGFDQEAEIDIENVLQDEQHTFAQSIRAASPVIQDIMDHPGEYAMNEEDILGDSSSSAPKDDLEDDFDDFEIIMHAVPEVEEISESTRTDVIVIIDEDEDTEDFGNIVLLVDDGSDLGDDDMEDPELYEPDLPDDPDLDEDLGASLARELSTNSEEIGKVEEKIDEKKDEKPEVSPPAVAGVFSRFFEPVERKPIAKPPELLPMQGHQSGDLIFGHAERGDKRSPGSEGVLQGHVISKDEVRVIARHFDPDPSDLRPSGSRDAFPLHQGLVSESALPSPVSDEDLLDFDFSAPPVFTSEVALPTIQEVKSAPEQALSAIMQTRLSEVEVVRPLIRTLNARSDRHMAMFDRSVEALPAGDLASSLRRRRVGTVLGQVVEAVLGPWETSDLSEEAVFVISSLSGLLEPQHPSVAQAMFQDFAEDILQTAGEVSSEHFFVGAELFFVRLAGLSQRKALFTLIDTLCEDVDRSLNDPGVSLEFLEGLETRVTLLCRAFPEEHISSPMVERLDLMARRLGDLHARDKAEMDRIERDPAALAISVMKRLELDEGGRLKVDRVTRLMKSYAILDRDIVMDCSMGVFSAPEDHPLFRARRDLFVSAVDKAAEIDNYLTGIGMSQRAKLAVFADGEDDLVTVYARLLGSKGLAERARQSQIAEGRDIHGLKTRYDEAMAMRQGLEGRIASLEADQGSALRTDAMDSLVADFITRFSGSGTGGVSHSLAIEQAMKPANLGLVRATLPIHDGIMGFAFVHGHGATDWIIRDQRYVESGKSGISIDLVRVRQIVSESVGAVDTPIFIRTIVCFGQVYQGGKAVIPYARIDDSRHDLLGRNPVDDVING